MKDVKSYLNLVGSRIGKAFSTQDFDIEKELEFWALSAEHMSRSEAPSFHDIVQWIDILYKAPIHIVYKKEGDELILFKRSIIVENIIGKSDSSSSKSFGLSELSEGEKISVNEFEQQVQNLEQKRKWYPELIEHGVSSNSVGNCEHIPLFDDDREVWGLYIVGPNTKCPDVIVPRLSIVGRLLSIWLSSIEKDEEGRKSNYQDRMEDIVSELGSGALNAQALSSFFLRFMLNGSNNKRGAIIENIVNDPIIVCNEGMNQEEINTFITNISNSFSDLKPQSYEFKDIGRIQVIPFKAVESIAALIMIDEELENKYEMDTITHQVSSQLGRLFSFRNTNDVFTDSLLNTYYEMLRVLERSRDKTKFHTPRFIAFIERFAMIFGLNEVETDIIKTASKLHDIGYVGGLSVDSKITIGSELSHPLTGFKLIDQLPLHDDIKNGILTHHEWINGSGTPGGIEGADIPWTGKVLSIFEYVVEFIESNINDTSKTDEEWINKLSQDIIERADIQFDMVLVPTVIELIKMLGWEMCCKIGSDD